MSTALGSWLWPQASVTHHPIDSVPPWHDEFWYGDPGGEASSGIYVSAQTVLRCATVFGAVRFLADSVAMCPSHVYRRTANDGSEIDRGHYVHGLLRWPNARDHGGRWRHQQVVWRTIYGNSYSRLIPGVTQPVESLRPLDPARVEVVDELADLSRVYRYSDPRKGQPETLYQQDVLHIPGLSLDGCKGVDMYRMIGNAVAIALAAERHLGSFLAKGMRLGGFLIHPTTMTQPQKQEFDASMSKLAGDKGVGRFWLLQGGMDFKPAVSDPKNAQVWELRDQQVGEILRFMGVPGVAVGWSGDKASTYASASEFFKSGLRHTLGPLVKALEDEIAFALLPRDDSMFVRFNMAVLQRTDTVETFEALAKGTGNRAVMSPNEGRRWLELNPSDDPDMDRIGAANDPHADRGSGPSSGGDNAIEGREFARPFVAAAARRLVALERAEMRRAALVAKAAKDPGAWADRVQAFYTKHAAHVADWLHCASEEASAYADGQASALIAQGLSVVDEWGDPEIDRLTRIGMGEA